MRVPSAVETSVPVPAHEGRPTQDVEPSTLETADGKPTKKPASKPRR